MEMPKSKGPLNPHRAYASFLTPKNKFSLLFALLFVSAVLGSLKLGHQLYTRRCPPPTDTREGTLELPPPPALSVESSSVGREDHTSPDAEEDGEENELDEEFWKQPDGMGYRPCMRFSDDYAAETKAIVSDRRKYLVAVVTGGLNQQRSQTIDAVVIARILGAALVVPVFSVNAVWEDESEFSDIFDVEHFKNLLKDDVRVVSNLPPKYWRMFRPVDLVNAIPFGASADWVRSKFLNQINRRRVILLRAFNARLSKDLPDDLQKLRCKVSFHALRFRPRILEVGNMLAERMRRTGRYLAIHLRVEKDVWLRTGCLPGLTPELDGAIVEERPRYPQLLTSRINMSYHERKLAGRCPLTVAEVTRLLKALGCPTNARIYLAGAEPYGGREVALASLVKEFPYLYSKEDLSLPGELEEFAKRPSLLAAIDYIVAESSDVFMQSHGGNMGRTIQGHRAYNGHKKYITPNKQDMMPYFLNGSLGEAEFNRIVKELHNETSLGQPHFKLPGKDVTAYPVPSCMCNTSFSM